MDVKQRLAHFFENKAVSNPSVAPPSPALRPQGYFEAYRAEAFRSPHTPSRMTGELWSNFSGQIYSLEYFPLSAILALYEDGAILWLDDHADDTDFEMFIRRERLIEWLPHRMDELLTLLIETKFNFLGHPQLIRQVEDIPTFTEKQVALMAKSKAASETFLEQEKRLVEVADQIQPPNYSIHSASVFQLNFHIWTGIMGQMIKVACFFESNGDFSYEATQLATHIGNFFVPR